MAAFDVDLFVIGAGSGGVRAARIAAGHGARVMIAEEYRVGGTCVIRGCVPKKLFVYASRFADAFEDAAGFGWTGIGTPQFDWAAFKIRRDAEVARLEAAYRANLERAGVVIVAERAVLDGPQAVRLASGRRITARVVLIATGGWPVLPDIRGRDLASTSNDVFLLPERPRAAAVVGGGYIAVEFAFVLKRLGVEQVTLVHRGDKVLRGFDEDMRDGMMAALGHAGIALEMGATLASLTRSGGRIGTTLSNGRSLENDFVLVATGRAPNTGGLGLQGAGVALDQSGAVKVDARSQSSVPSVYAVGDVTNRVNLTPVAIREGHAFADTVFGGREVKVDHANVPGAVFGTPELATVGLTEETARARFADVVVYKTSFRPMKATISGRQERTIMKLVVDGRTDRLLGCHILGDDAAEMIQLVAVVIRMGGCKADLDATVALHPSAAEELVTLRTPFVPPIPAKAAAI